MSRHTARKLDGGTYVVEDAEGRYLAVVPGSVAGACQTAMLFAAAAEMRHTLARIAAGQCADPEAEARAAVRRCLVVDPPPAPPTVPFLRPVGGRPDGAA